MAPTVNVLFFRDDDGSAPFLKWFDRLPTKAKVQSRARLHLLADQGHMLRRPAADYLREGVYELRVKANRVQYRILYFFHGQEVVILHGITKQEAAVPPVEIDRAFKQKRLFEAAPEHHTYKETL